MAQHVNITTQKTGTVLDPCCSMFSAILCDRSEIITPPVALFWSKTLSVVSCLSRVRSHAHITCRKECVDSELPANSIILILILSLIMAATLLHMECLVSLLLGFLMEVACR